MKRIRSVLFVIFIVGILCTGCNAKPTESTTPNTEKSFEMSDYIADKSLWEMPYIYQDRFLFEIANGGECVLEDGLGEPNTLFGIQGQERWAHAEEWGNFIINCEGITWRDGQILETHFSGDESPKTREEAIRKINDFLDANYKTISSTDTLYSINSICYWQHYAAENGFDVVGAEFAESYNFQIPLAFTRGAGKQYQIPWYIDFSMFYGTVPDYAGEYFAKIYYVDYDGTMKPYGAPDYGHSLNMLERSIIMSYMAGARAVVAQDGGQLAYWNYSDTDSTPQYDGNSFFWNWNGTNVSPYGEVCKKFYSFTKEYSDIGTAYTPYAIILDKYHGLTSMGFQDPFDRFYAQDGDLFTQNVLSQIWTTADKPDKESKKNLVNNKYGESFDVLLQNASDEILSTYKALILTGELVLSDEEVQRYTNYVKNGGCIVINTAYVNQFTDAELPSEISLGNYYEEIPYGNGSFIVFGKGGLIEKCIDLEGNSVMLMGADYGISGFNHVMELLMLRYNVFDISADVDYLVSMKEDTVYLTLINNDGVTKTRVAPPVFDESKTVNLTVNFKENYSVESVCDIYNSTPVEYNNGTVSLTLPAGGIAVLEFKLK